MVFDEGRRLNLMRVVVCGRIISATNNQNIGLIYHRVPILFYLLLQSLYLDIYIIFIETYLKFKNILLFTGLCNFTRFIFISLVFYFTLNILTVNVLIINL